MRFLAPVLPWGSIMHLNLDACPCFWSPACHLKPKGNQFGRRIGPEPAYTNTNDESVHWSHLHGQLNCSRNYSHIFTYMHAHTYIHMHAHAQKHVANTWLQKNIATETHSTSLATVSFNWDLWATCTCCSCLARCSLQKLLQEHECISLSWNAWDDNGVLEFWSKPMQVHRGVQYVSKENLCWWY